MITVSRRTYLLLRSGRPAVVPSPPTYRVSVRRFLLRASRPSRAAPIPRKEGIPTWLFLAMSPPEALISYVPPPTTEDVPQVESALKDIVARLGALGVFSDVRLGTSVNDLTEPASNAATAAVWLIRWADTPEGDSQDTTWMGEAYEFGLAIELNMHDAANRALRLVWLTRLAKRALNGKDLGGVCEPDRTVLGEGRTFEEAHPNAAMVVTGRFTCRTVGMANQEPADIYLS
jgi:hypothetical protein